MPRPAHILALACAVALVTGVAGCGGDAATPPTNPPAATPAPGTTAAALPPSTAPSAVAPTVDKEIVVTVTNKKVTPPTSRFEVRKGDSVRITVTSDVPDNLHVHGYDHSADLPAGQPASIAFRADQTGLFEVETHHTKLVLFQLVVR